MEKIVGGGARPLAVLIYYISLCILLRISNGVEKGRECEDAGRNRLWVVVVA